MAHALEPMQEHDWPAVRAIYREGLATGLAAFVSEPPGWRSWHRDHLAIGRLVARDDDGAVAGWAALAPAPDT